MRIICRLVALMIKKKRFREITARQGICVKTNDLLWAVYTNSNKTGKNRLIHAIQSLEGARNENL
jgi:hypothetical protein